MLPFALRELKKRKLSLKFSDFAFFTLSGVVGIVISMSFFQLAVLNTKASTVAAIFSTNSVFTIPFAGFILKERINRRMLLSMLISLAGILLIFNPFSSSPDVKGVLPAFLAAITFSLFGVISKARVGKYGGLILNCFSFLIGDMILLTGMLLFKSPVVAGVHAGNILNILYISIFVTGAGYLCYFEAMRLTSAITTSMVFFIKPALAAVLASVILGEKISLNMVMGILCIISAALIVIPKNIRAAGALSR